MRNEASRVTGSRAAGHWAAMALLRRFMLRVALAVPLFVLFSCDDAKQLCFCDGAEIPPDAGPFPEGFDDGHPPPEDDVADANLEDGGAKAEAGDAHEG